MTEPTDQPYPAEPPAAAHPQPSEPPPAAAAQPGESPPATWAQPGESEPAVPPYPAEPPTGALAYPTEPPTAALPYPTEAPVEQYPYPPGGSHAPYPPGGSPGPYPPDSYPSPYPPGAYPQGALPPGPPAARRRRTGLIVGIVLGIVLLLCAGGGVMAYVLVQNSQPTGAADPKTAVDGFLAAVFSSHNAQEAADFVCPDARDKEQLEALVNQVTSFESQFDSPQTKWVTPPVPVSGKTATATVKLELTTANEQVAEKQIRLHLVDRRGWWVCDVEPAT